MDLQSLTVVTLAVADFARYVNVRQEVHLDLDDAVAGAVLAAAPFHVEAEAAGAVAPQLRFGHLGEQFTDRREQTGVGRRIGARRAADRALVDDDGLVELFD